MSALPRIPIPPEAKIWVAGHNGMVGGAIVRKLRETGHDNLVLRSSKELDLTDQRATFDFLQSEKPEYAFIAAAKVGGIWANSQAPAEFGWINLAIATNAIHGAHLAGVRKLLYLGSSCIYPRLAPQPIHESDLLTGALEPTNEAYAVAKIAGLRLCAWYRRQYGDVFIAAMPTNLFGPGDNFHPEKSHVLPALIRKFHEAKLSGAPEVVVWGSGKPLREFHYVDDLADGLVWLMEHYSGEEHRNIGTGEEVSIAQLAKMVAETVGYSGRIVFDPSKPDGTPRKLMDCSKIHAEGWHHRIGLREGLEKTYAWFLEQKESGLRGW